MSCMNFFSAIVEYCIKTIRMISKAEEWLRDINFGEAKCKQNTKSSVVAGFLCSLLGSFDENMYFCR